MIQQIALKVGTKLAVTGLTVGKAVLANVASGLALAATEMIVHKVREYQQKKK